MARNTIIADCNPDNTAGLCLMLLNEIVVSVDMGLIGGLVTEKNHGEIGFKNPKCHISVIIIIIITRE